MNDLAAYLARVGFDGVPRADLATLRQLALRQPMAIAFENLDAYLGRRVSLDPADVERKLVAGGRGGWCFEHNLLLGEALRAIGFDVTDLAGRVVLGREADAVAARTHRLLRVRIEGAEWIADAGFGGLTLTDVLDLHADAAQQTPHGWFRLRPMGSERLMETQAGETWMPMFRFDLQPQFPVDYEAVNFRLVHDPASSFVQRLGVSVMAPEGRHGLRGHELSFLDRQGNRMRRELDTPEVIDALADVFGIETDAGTREAVAAKLERTRAADAPR